MKLVFHALLWLGVVSFATGHPVDIACAGLDKCGGLGTEHAGTAIVEADGQATHRQLADSGSGDAGSGSGSGDAGSGSGSGDVDDDDSGGGSHSGGLTRDEKIGIGIGCGAAGLIVMGGIGYFIYKKKGDGVRVVREAGQGPESELNKI